MLSSQSFLWLNLGFALAIAGIFLVGRNRLRAPARLNLKSSRRALDPKTSSHVSFETQKVSGDDFEVKNLNVVFMFNGHSWDAYEVLGIPAGSRPEIVKAAYVKALQTTDMQTRSFIEAAYRAINS